MFRSLITTSRQIGLLTIALTVALLGNFAYGQWAGPSAPPPGGNVEPPVNVSSAYQYKAGNLGAVDFIAGNMMRSNQYCDFDGGNCWNPASSTPSGGGGAGSLTPGSGYQWVGPLLYQWGRECPGGTTNYPFPIPFPTQVLQVVGGGASPNPNATRANHTAVAIDNSTVQISTPYSAICTVYIAIGY